MKQPYALSLLALLALASCASSTKTTTPATGGQEMAAASDFQLDRVNVAVINTESMVAFYQSVFKMRFKKVDGPGAYLYEGKILGINYLFVPNEVAKIRADQSRYTIEVKVSDIDGVIDRAVNVGGTVRGGLRTLSDRRTATILDPDGNALVFFQNY